MRRAAEIIAFLGLSAMVHAGVMAGIGDSMGGPQAQGQGGVDRVTLTAAPESMAAMADRWTAAPQAMIRPTALQSPDMGTQPMMPRHDPAAPGLTLPRAPQLAHPDAPPTAPSMSDSAPPPPDTALAQSPRPTPRPATHQSAPQSAPQPARIAQGHGGGVTNGAATALAPTTPALSQAQRQSLMAEWGGQIMARIERARPRVTGKGQVTLTLRIGRDGMLAALGVAQGSGNTALDEAALAAVRRAGQFPAAPEALREASYAFTLPIRFR